MFVCVLQYVVVAVALLAARRQSFLAEAMLPPDLPLGVVVLAVAVALPAAHPGPSLTWTCIQAYINVRPTFRTW